MELVELFACLSVEVFAVDNKQAFFDVRVVLKQGGRLKGRERFAAAGGVPDESVAAVLMDAPDQMLHGIDLIRSHHQELLLAGNQHHVPADGRGQRTFCEKRTGELVEVGDLLVRLVGVLVNRQEPLFGIECEMPGVVVGEVVGAVAVADDEQLHEAQQRFTVTVARIVFVFDDLLHGHTRVDAERFELDLRYRNAIDEQNHVVAVVAVVGVDTKLVDHLKSVLAPVLDVDQGEIQRGPVVASKAVTLAKGAGVLVYVRCDDLVEQSLKF